MKTIILINTGTPDSPETRDVRRYLSQFLNDKRVIDIPWLFRKLLVNLIIVPFRSPRSAALYKRLWTEKGSPLKINMEELVNRIREISGNDLIVKGAFRYGSPSIPFIMEEVRKSEPEEVILIPLFPQYASSTTGSVIEAVNNELNKWEKMPGIRIIEQFYSHPAYIRAMTRHLQKYDPGTYDYVLFSYHGLPLRQLRRIHPETDPASCNCTEVMPAEGSLCYKASCYDTSRILAEKLDLKDCRWGTSFQSRLTKHWTGPFTDSVLSELARSGKSRILVTAPSFVADCLETLIEIQEEYRDIFLAAGGTEFTFAESLNSSNEWAEAVIEIAKV